MHSDQPGDTLQLEIPSDLGRIGTAISALDRFLKQHRVSGQSMARATVILRELVVNAITHGSRGKAASYISITVERADRLDFKITVEDTGSGFNYAALDTHLPDNPRVIQKRGYALIKASSQRYEFNAKGNRVTAYFSDLAKEESIEKNPSNASFISNR
jgi:anti-sigma regulatory factor (Ser/Thr protein kinase)